MKILILCTPRSGSTSLINTLADVLNINKINIPDAYEYPKNKSLIDHIMLKKDIIVRMNPNQEVGYTLKEFVKFFDHIILLTRKNTKEHFESFVNLYYKEIIKKEGVHSTYTFSEIPNELKTKLKNDFSWINIKNAKSKIENLSIEISNPILYYEDLYYGNGISYLYEKIKNIDRHLLELNLFKTKKLRQPSIQKTII